MKFKAALNIDCGIMYMFESLDIKSGFARKMLLESEMMLSKGEIDFYYSKINELFYKDYGELSNELHCVKDISCTLNKLQNNEVLSDIELFEVKSLAMVCGKVSGIINKLKIKKIGVPTLKNVLEILDPDSNGVAAFYVYDSYSAKLKEIREKIKRLVGADGNVESGRSEEYTTLMGENEVEEKRVRGWLSGRLKEYVGEMEFGLRNLGALDILVAKTEQIKKMGLCFPVVVDEGETFYCGMFNPFVIKCLDGKKEFQRIDICFDRVPVTIIGANMGGKSVVLKTLALNQLLTQFGFGVAANNCCVCVVDKVILCSDVEQSVKDGISSFGAEIVAINEVIGCARSGMRNLALIDEPARTTNPIEGKALVEGLIDVLSELKGKFVITTHYNIDTENIKRYRVMGLVSGEMDYSLLEVFSGEIPQEAINIAINLNIDNQWIINAKNRLKKN